MKVLFVGFGDIARRASTLFLDSGWEVTGLRRTPAEVSEVNMVTGDCRDRELLVGLVESHELVVVTLTPDSYTEEGYRQSYVTPALTMRDSLRQAGKKPGLVLWISSTGVYGRGHGEWVEEATPAEPETFSGQFLLKAENIVADAPVPVTVVRFSGIYGPARGRMIRQVREGRCAPASPATWSNRIHADDCAGVIHHLARCFFSGQELDRLYIGTDCEPAPLHDVHTWLAEQLNVEVSPRETGKTRGNRRCSNARLLGTGYEFHYPTYREGYAALLREMGLAGDD